MDLVRVIYTSLPRTCQYCLMYKMTMLMEDYSVAHSKRTVRPKNGTLSVGLDVGVGEGKWERSTRGELDSHTGRS